MAFVIVTNIRDEKNRPSRFEVNLPSGTAWTDVVLFAQQFAPLANALFTGKVVSIGICYELSLSGLGLNAVAASGSDVEEGARFQFASAGGFPTAFRIPTFDESKIVAGSRDVDLTDGDVAALVTAMEDGIDLTGVGGSGIIQPSDKRDDDVDALSYAREQFNSS